MGSTWFLCNDAAVSKVALGHVLNASAYLLFYQRDVLQDIPTQPRSGAAQQQEAEALSATEQQAASTTAAAGGPEEQEQEQRPQEQRSRPAAGAAAGAEQEDGSLEGVLSQGLPALAVLSRVHTAPASICAGRLHAPPTARPPSSTASSQRHSGSRGLSPASSVDPLAVGDGGLPNTSQPLHASVSESDLYSNVSPHSKRERRLCDSAAGVAVDEHASAKGGGPEGDSDDSDSVGDLIPSANAFNLLGTPEEEEEEEEGILESLGLPRPASEAPEEAASGGSGSGEDDATAGRSSVSGGATTVTADSLELLSGWSGSMNLDQPCRTPTYLAEQEQLEDGTCVLRLVVELPGASDAKVEVEQQGSRQQLLVHTGDAQVALALPLPVHIAPAPVSRQWQDSVLTATFLVNS